MREKATVARCYSGMTRIEKAVYAFAGVLALLIAGVFAAYWWANTVPGRPKAIAERAVFLWAPYVGFPAPRRGWWISCSEDAGHNRCTLTDVDGRTEYEGEFVLDDAQGPVPSGRQSRSSAPS